MRIADEVDAGGADNADGEGGAEGVCGDRGANGAESDVEDVVGGVPDNACAAAAARARDLVAARASVPAIIVGMFRGLDFWR